MVPSNYELPTECRGGIVRLRYVFRRDLVPHAEGLDTHTTLSSGSTDRRSRSRLLLCWIAAVSWRADPGRAHEQTAAVREGEIAPVGSVRAVLRTIPVNEDLGAFG